MLNMFQIDFYLFQRAYAGVVLSSPGLEDCPVPLYRGLVGWAVLDFGTSGENGLIEVCAGPA